MNALHPLSSPFSNSPLDLLLGRLGVAWSVERLSQVLGVSQRTLHRLFIREYGVSPMALVRRLRLQSARQRLETPDPGATVTAVALDCGFVHLGRFSVEYARQFGECPSDTLRRSRHRADSRPDPRARNGRAGAPAAGLGRCVA